MIIQCPACESRYRIDVSQTSKSRVRVKCPKCQHPFEVEVDQEVPAASADPSPDVLVVDDARFFREAVLDILQPLDLKIATAGDGETALAVLQRERPKLVIVDLRLPNMDGHQFIRTVRSDPGFAGTRLLAMSSVFRQDEEVRRVMQAGADEFLNKSFTPQQLLLLVRRLLSL